MDWASILKGVFSVAASFGAGWAGAVLSDVSYDKAIASGVVAACTWYLGNRQETVNLTK